MPIRLEVDDGRDVRAVRLPRAAGTVGRSEGSDVRLACAGVSRRHARLRVVGDALEVIDLHSKNGLLIRGERVPRALVAPGETFSIGSARITLVEAAPETRLVAPPRPAHSAPPVRKAPQPSAPPLRLARDHADFDELLYAALRKTPWYGVSAALHLLLFLALTFVDLGLARPAPIPDDVVVALSDGSAAGDLDDHVDEVQVDDVVDDMERLLPDEDHDPLPFEPVPLDAPEEDTLLETPMTLEPATDARFGMDALGDMTLGLAPTADLGTRLGTSFGKDDAGTANATAARTLRSSPFSRAVLQGLRLRTSSVNVRVIGGEYDQCENVLDLLGLHHDEMLPEELDLACPGAEVRALFYNCTSKPLSERALDHIEAYVRGGGYLFTTDWGLENVLERRFSQYVRTLRQRGRVVMTEDEVISFEAVADHPLLRGLPRESVVSRWWLEDSSILVDIVDRKAVDVLIASKDLERRHGSNVVAVTFRHGRGRVVHVLGHFFQREGNLSGTVAMQRILMNFLYQSLRGG